MTDGSAETLKRTRELLRLSQARMAQHMNLPVRWVQDLEQGRNGMTAPVRLLFKVMEMNPEAVKKAASALRDEEGATNGR